MTDDSAFTRGVQRIAESRRLEKGQGQTRKLHHAHYAPTSTSNTFEAVAAGLAGDSSGLLDIMDRVLLVSEDSALELVHLHIRILFQARIFKRVSEVAEKFVELNRDQPYWEREDTFLQLLADGEPLLLSQDEAYRIAEGIHSVAGDTIEYGDVLESAQDHLNGFSYKLHKNLQGLGGKITDRGVVLVYLGDVRRPD